ncbi:hypothetical protein [Flavobacterium sp.]|jgi:hypothetical protein|uniref:hypothetical protein n=1 Tax=Flavobacterium sp. TaxID=239 RepID=UPI0037BFEAEE
MSNTTIVEAILLPSGINTEPTEVLVDDYTSIQNLVGGNFDCVRTDLGKPEEVALVGYVNDMGLVINLELNYLASALFGREIRGDAVVTWGLSPNGYYDGDNHDMPNWISCFLKTDLLMQTATAYNLAATLDVIASEIVSSDYPDKDKLLAVLSGDDHRDRGADLEKLQPWEASAIAEALMWGSENLDDEELRDGCAMMLGFFENEE